MSNKIDLQSPQNDGKPVAEEFDRSGTLPCKPAGDITPAPFFVPEKQIPVPREYQTFEKDRTAPEFEHDTKAKK